LEDRRPQLIEQLLRRLALRQTAARLKAATLPLLPSASFCEAMPLIDSGDPLELSRLARQQFVGDDGIETPPTRSPDRPTEMFSCFAR
jgi:hypothetical protein